MQSNLIVSLFADDALASVWDPDKKPEIDKMRQNYKSMNANNPDLLQRFMQNPLTMQIRNHLEEKISYIEKNYKK